ncbi:hypothetical protein M409DRAFT_23498 [Zasmidium cellare ATCC 36951]|uniref:Uncharacterized protein n=1 Tax=Zasmidium cellare ATCC 36951 TaxID=1080233 RepID=A0A6A6CLJ6_ZASCE|nr:uncharacterized protein M409DRAFT_23498 [Zasmidium cellare ATCC 36951]KAF2166306.1 hypothetical protein M409DRAFT_23498 [Zasmidium cellare ATCC 36951]
MRLSTFSLAAALACSALSAAVPVVAKTPALPEQGAHHLSPRAQYNIDTFEDLEEEATRATQDEITASVNYLANFWSANGATWALTGGIAMQKYGMTERTTQDSDLGVSILPLAITNAAAADANIQYPPALMAASGTVTLFVNINGQQVQNDVFPPNSELAPSLDNTVTIDGWPIVSILSLIKSKVRRAEDQDIIDVAWFCTERLNDVTAIASQIDYQSRLSFASDAKARRPADFDVICPGLQLDPSQVPSK